MDGMVDGLSKQGWYAPSGGTGPVASMDGRAGGWATEGDQIAVGPHDGHGWSQYAIGPVQEHACGTLAEGMRPGDAILSAVEGWDHSFMDPRRDWGGDGGLG